MQYLMMCVLRSFVCLFLFPLSELTEKETSLQMQGGQNFAKEDVRHSQSRKFLLFTVVQHPKLLCTFGINYTQGVCEVQRNFWRIQKEQFPQPPAAKVKTHLNELKTWQKPRVICKLRVLPQQHSKQLIFTGGIRWNNSFDVHNHFLIFKAFFHRNNLHLALCIYSKNLWMGSSWVCGRQLVVLCGGSWVRWGVLLLFS